MGSKLWAYLRSNATPAIVNPASTTILFYNLCRCYGARTDV